VLITGEDFVKPLSAAGLPLWKTSAVIACSDPYYAMALLSEKFAEKLSSVAHLGIPRVAEIHPTAVIHPLAEVASGVSIGAHCVVEAGAKIGIGSVLYPGCYVGPGAKLGDRCVLFPGVTLYEWSELGNRVRVHAGAVIGSDGFGYAPKKEGDRVVGLQKIHHLGKVVIEDDVEIGANTCLDRATFGETRVRRGAKLDNQVHIGHNAEVGDWSAIAGGTALAGSAKIGRFVQMGGLTGVTNQVVVGDGAQVGAVSLVTKDVAPGSTAVGNPQREYREHFRAHAALNKLIKKGQKG
jgi:UDP-3-O-[3-hydroxymyristoyl] glucosamine N-acyltransferase